MGAGFVFCKKTLTVYIQGELDHHSAKEIRFRIDSEISRRSPQILELDFSGVTFMDSSGIGLVMGRYKIMSELNGVVVIVNPPQHIKKVMMISGITRLAKIVNRKEETNVDNKMSEVKKIETCKQEHSEQNENILSGVVSE